MIPVRLISQQGGGRPHCTEAATNMCPESSLCYLHMPASFPISLKIFRGTFPSSTIPCCFLSFADVSRCSNLLPLGLTVKLCIMLMTNTKFNCCERKWKKNEIQFNQMIGFMTIKTGNLVHSPIYNLREPWHLLFIPIQGITTQDWPGNILGRVFILGWQSKVGINSHFFHH